jgi:hypothetical protein
VSDSGPLLRGAVMVIPGSPVIWQVPDSTVTWAVCQPRRTAAGR